MPLRKSLLARYLFKGEALSADKWMMSLEGTTVMGPHNNLLNGVQRPSLSTCLTNSILKRPQTLKSFLWNQFQDVSKAEKRRRINAPVCTLLRRLLGFELMG